ncbi:MAG TPA: efflux transporter outer membrane subunit [Smithella sp.]|nr:efflux transporter outer membrane subunit [Smithella sp.]
MCSVRFYLLACACFFLLSACSPGPEYTHPDIPVPPSWSVKPADGPQWPSQEWWRGFSSPELNNLMLKARQTNDDIIAAIARVKEADADARIAGAALLPQVSGSVAVSRERQPVSGSDVYSTYTQYYSALNASYEIDFWGKNRATSEAAKSLATASRFDRETIELSVETSVASLYFQALELHDRIAIAENSLKNAQSILAGLRAEETAGTATDIDVLQQEIVVEQLGAALSPLRQQLRQTLDALAVLTGQNPEKIEAPQSSLADLREPPVRPGLPSELLFRRPDVASSEAQLIAANANIKAARAAFFPSIDLTANGGYISTALSSALNASSGVFVLGAAVTQPIFEGGALKGQLEFSNARYEELLANYHKTVIGAFSNVEDSLVAIQQTQEQQRRQQDAVVKAERTYRFTLEQFHAGTVNILTVLNVQNALFSVKDALAQTHLLHLQAVLGLINALGGGWQKE